jgi:hypothetical protein
MANLTAKEITNYYLYGTKFTPSNLVDDSLIRLGTPRDTFATTTISVDVKEFMASAGRFAIGSQFELVNKFFDLDNPIQPGTYDKSQLRTFFNLPFIGWLMQHFNWIDDIDDYAERVYIWNSQGYQISKSAKFIVKENGEREIKDFGIEPLPEEPDTIPTDNFDFVGSNDNPIIKFAAEEVYEPRVDPSGIGRRVDIRFVGTVNTTTYTQSDYDNDVLKRLGVLERPGDFSQIFPTAAPIPVFILVDSFLYDQGVTKFLDDQNRPILYGTVGADILSAEILNNPSDQTIYPKQQGFKDNGVVLIGGDGTDTLTGGTKSDRLFGGDDSDILNGEDGNDTLYGDAGGDTLNGGNNDDRLFGGEGSDRLNGDAGNDLLVGEGGNDTIFGGSGFNNILGFDIDNTTGKPVNTPNQIDRLVHSSGSRNIFVLTSGGVNAYTTGGDYARIIGWIPLNLSANSDRLKVVFGTTAVEGVNPFGQTALNIIDPSGDVIAYLDGVTRSDFPAGSFIFDSG